MNRLLATLALAATLVLGGCAGTQLGKFVDVATTTVTNPVKPVNIYQVKTAYKAALGIAVDYREYCYARSYKSLMADPIAKPICQNRRGIIRSAQAAQVRARSAIDKADAFVKANPTVGASAIVTAAWDAVKDFQLSIPAPQK